MILKKFLLKNFSRIFVLLIIFSALNGCCVFSSIHFDQSSIQNIIECRGRILVLYDMILDNPDELMINDIRNDIIRMQNYEQKKGCNNESIKCTGLILSMFNQHMKDRKAGNWSIGTRDNNLAQIDKLIDQAIKTEEAKTK